jgi:cytochrome c2
MKVMKRHISILLCLLPLLAIPAFSQQGGAGSAGQKQKETTNRTAKDAQRSAGELKFQQNCSRCHNAPEGFSPRISGTIVRHMRVRALLSKKDADDILKFLNP